MGCWGSEEGECHGNIFLWNNEKPAVVKGEWFCWEMMIKLNDPPDARNGEQAFWINGVRYAHFGPGFPNYAYSGTDRWGADESGSPWPGFQWRTDPDLKINYIWIYNYVHDDVCRAWFDDVVVATSYIGPMVDESTIMNKPTFSAIRSASLIQKVNVTSDGFLTLHLNPKKNTATTVSVCTFSGRQVRKFTDIRSIRFRCSINSLPHGMYFVRVSSGKETDNRHFSHLY